MTDFLNQNKIFIVVVIATLALLFGGVFLFSKNPSNQSSGPKVNPTFLEPADGLKTSGIENGNYIPASPSATVTIVEFGDYECPACGAYSPIVKQILTQFAGKIIYVFKNFPLSQHANAPISSYAAEAAALQGQLWQMHDKLYDSQNDWSNSTDARTIFLGYAKEMGLNVSKFTNDIDSQNVKDIVNKDLGDGNSITINATPTFYVDGVKIDSPASADDFAKIIQAAINKAPKSSR